MVRVVYAKILSHSAESLWRIVADVNTWPEWNDAIASVRITDAVGIGASFDLHLRRGPLSAFRATIDTYTPHRQLRFSGGSGGIRIRCSLDCIPADLQTKMQIELEYSGPMMWLNALFGPPKSIEDLALHWITDIEKRAHNTSHGDHR